MGTNFYIDKEETKHIGKRSAAGLYCFDCNATLCAGGESEIHQGRSEWLSLCPGCGETAKDESLSNSTGGIELGFNKDTTEDRQGVRSCCSFSWALKPEEFFMSQPISVWDEYGREIPFIDFCKMLEAACPVRYYQSIGKEFS